MRPDEAVPPQSRSDKAPASSPVASRDVLREAGIEYVDAVTPGWVFVRRADVEGLIAERDEADEALKAIVALRNTKIQGASAPQTAGWEVTEVLDAAENKLRQMAREFMGPNFTDRYDDGPAMLKIAERIAALRAAGTAGEPASLLSGKFTDSHLRSLKLMVAFHEANAEHVGGFDHVTQAKQAIALLGEALHPTDPAGSVPASGAKVHHPQCAVYDERDCDCFHGGAASPALGSGSPTVCTEHNAPRSGCAVCRAQEEEAAVGADPRGQTAGASPDGSAELLDAIEDVEARLAESDEALYRDVEEVVVLSYGRDIMEAARELVVLLRSGAATTPPNPSVGQRPSVGGGE